jgi:hypothetical protein
MAGCYIASGETGPLHPEFTLLLGNNRMSGYQQQPFASPTPGSFDPPPAKKGWGIGCIIGIIAIVLGGGTLVCCGSFFGLGFFAANFALTLSADQVKQNPVVKQHVGEVTACNIDLTATGELNKPEHFVFNVEGTKGKAVVTVHVQAQGENVRILDGNIRLPTGETYELVPK